MTRTLTIEHQTLLFYFIGQKFDCFYCYKGKLKHRSKTKFGPFWKVTHQVALIAMVTNSATRWRHLYWFELWPPGVTCIATLPWNALLGYQLVSSSARVTSVKSAKVA